LAAQDKAHPVQVEPLLVVVVAQVVEVRLLVIQLDLLVVLVVLAAVAAVVAVSLWVGPALIVMR
jgi:hypothetical protein